MANRYISDDDIPGSADKLETPESLYVDLQGDQRTRPVMCATEFSGGGSAHKKKSSSFQITSVTVQGSRLSNDGGDDSADDLDESHTEDISSDILDCSKTTDLDNDPLSSADSNANLDDMTLPLSSKQFIPVKVLTSDADSLGASSVGLHVGFPVANSLLDTGVTFMTSTTTSLPVMNSQVPIVNSLAEHLQHRFKVVKVVSTEPFKRGRWMCMDFTDPPAIHSEQKLESFEVNDTLQVTGTFNLIPSENSSTSQIYEIPVNQQSMSMAQHPTQSVYGILLPVSNNVLVTKIQGVQATSAPPAEPSNQEGFNIPTPPNSTQSQPTLATVSTSNAPLMQPQLSQMTPNNSQSQNVSQSSQSQGVYAPTNPNQGIQVSQSTPGISQASQVVPTAQPPQILPASIPQPTQGVNTNQTIQALPVNVIQNTPINVQPQPGIQFTQPPQPGTQQGLNISQPPPQDLHTTQQSQVLSQAMNQSQAVPPLHVLANTQPLQGLTTQGIPLQTQGMPANQGISVPQPGQGIAVSQPSQGLPVSQPGQALPISQLVQGIPVPQPGQAVTISQSGQGLSVSQPGQGLSASQPGQGPSVPQPGLGISMPLANQGTLISQPIQGLPILLPSQGPLPGQGITIPQPIAGQPLSQSSNVVHGTTGNQGLPLTVTLPVQGISTIQISQPSQVLPIPHSTPAISNQAFLTNPQELLPNAQATPALGLSVVQPTQSSQGTTSQTTAILPTSQVPPVISVTQNNPNLPASTQTISLNQMPQSLPPTSSLTTPQPAVQPVLNSDPTSMLPQNDVSLPNPATDESVNIETCVPSQSVTAPPTKLSSVNETATVVATSAAKPSLLLDILPDTLGTKILQEGEESERTELAARETVQTDTTCRVAHPETDRTGMEEALLEACASSGTNTVAIDNKIEQAMDLVKSHLMFAVREEVDVLKEKITELLDRISQLEHENGILKANATPELLNQLNSDPPQQQGSAATIPPGSAVPNGQPPSTEHP